MNQALEKYLEGVAKKHFNVETLETRNSDSLDFYDVSVASMKAALSEAYFAGVQSGYTAAHAGK
jgi:hypothetical protein